ncbi:hypothetical protein Vi05172_g8012 [Venturia inaequalis]|nr:hypothetical protein Vi05172_g8012 [Venturia inaequalis]
MVPKRKAEAQVCPSTMAKVLGTSPQKLGRQMTQIFVGGDREPHCVHRDLISASSDFFKRALCGSFKEKNGIVRLREESSDDFAVYVAWLYSGRLNYPPKVENSDDKNDDYDSVLRDYYQKLLELHIMGDTIQDEEFQNATTDAIIELASSSQRPPLHESFARSAMTYLPLTSSLRKYLVDCWVYFREPCWYEDGSVTLGEYPAGFWIEVAKGLTNQTKKLTPGAYPWELNPCLYHSHKKEAQKPKLA